MQSEPPRPSWQPVSLWNLPFSLLERLGPRRLVWLGVPLLVHAWTLFAPFVGDDLHMVVRTEQYLRGERNDLRLFDFGATVESRRELIERGTIPWWSPLDCPVAFFRPLAELSWLADVAVFGRWTLGHRLESLGWFALALICVHRLYGTVSGDKVRAGVATFLFGISQPAAGTLTLVCNRSDLLVVVGVSVAAHAYWSSSARPRLRTLIVAAIAFGFALLSKETALPLAGVILLCEALRGRRAIRQPGRSTVALSLVALAIVYVAFYLATQPVRARVASNWDQLATLVSTWPQSFGLYAAMWTTGVPVQALYFLPAAWLLPAAAILGAILAAVIMWYLFRCCRADSGAGFFALWTLGFLSLALLTIPEPRALCLATVGWAYLLTGLLVPRGQSCRVAPGAVRHGLLAASGVISIIASIAVFAVHVRLDEHMSNTMAAYVANLEPPLASGDTLIMAKAESGFDVPFAGDRLEYLAGMKGPSATYLTVADAHATFVREDDHTLCARSTSPALFDSLMHRLILGPRFEPKVGKRYLGPGFTAEIAAVQDGVVTELRFTFEQPLTSPRLRFAPDALSRIARGE